MSPPDWGPGFKRGTEKPECIHHGREFMSGGIGADDVGFETCLACAEPKGQLTEAGVRALAELRGTVPLDAAQDIAEAELERQRREGATA